MPVLAVVSNEKKSLNGLSLLYQNAHACKSFCIFAI